MSDEKHTTPQAATKQTFSAGEIAAISLLRSGSVLLLGEYRGGKADRIEYIDKDNPTGAKKVMKKASFIVEVGTGRTLESLNVTKLLKDDVDVDKYDIPFVKGDIVIAVVYKMSADYTGRDVTCTDIIKA